MPTPFATKILSAKPEAVAPDGSLVRLLPALPGGGMAHFELAAGATSHAVRHRTVEEIWFVISGAGEIWRRQEGLERIEPLAAGVAATIPLGTAFQFRANPEAPLVFLAVTMPPWPGMDEAVPVEGPWTPTAPRPGD